MKHGEMSISLQDVAIIMGLRIDGHHIFEYEDNRTWEEICMESLGVVPQDANLKKSKVKLNWLRDTFMHPLPDDATVVEVERVARAYMLHMIGTLLFPDLSKNRVSLRWLIKIENIDFAGQISWGSALLSNTYAELDKLALMAIKEFRICGILIQTWSWEHLHIGRPTIGPHNFGGVQHLECKYTDARSFKRNPTRSLDYYRNELDMTESSKIIWMPYAQVLAADPPPLNPLCTMDVALWRARLPMFCFEAIGFHLPDRFLRQFGLRQHIPEPPPVKPNRRGLTHNQFLVYVGPLLGAWQDRANQIVNERVPPPRLREYLEWYWDVTVRWVFTPNVKPPVEYMPRGGRERALVSFSANQSFIISLTFLKLV